MSQESGSRRRTVDRHHGLCPEAGHLPARVNVTRVHCRRVLNSQVGMCLTPGLPIISPAPSPHAKSTVGRQDTLEDPTMNLPPHS